MRLEEHIVTERLPYVGRSARRYPSNLKPGRLDQPTVPVSGAAAWWDASARSTVTETTARLTAIADRSGNAVTLSEITSTLPSYNSVPAHLRPSLATLWGFPDVAMSAGLSASTRTQSVFVAANVFDLGSNRCLIGASGNGGRVFRVETSGRLRFTKRFVSDLVLSSAGMAVTVGTPFVAAMILSATDCTFRLNNVTPETTAESTGLTAALTSEIGTGDGSTTTRWRGWIGEMIVYNSTLSSGDADLVMAYLMSKWAVS